MQQTVQTTAGMDGTERRRVEAVVETLATLRSQGESLEEVAHDARNMVTALGLYCDLLEEPGVLATQFLHYGSELRLVAAASRRLVEKLVALDAHEAPEAGSFTDSLRGQRSLPAAEVAGGRPVRSGVARSRCWWDSIPAQLIDNLAAELMANRNLLAALAGPSIAVTVDAEEGLRPVSLTGEDLTRILVNLARNSAEAMPAGGWIHLRLREHATSSEASPLAGSNAQPSLLLTVEDNGPGIPGEVLNKIFNSGYTTRLKNGNGGWPVTHRGLGLSITRSIIEKAGGRIHAANRSPSGARFQIELPIRNR